MEIDRRGNGTIDPERDPVGYANLLITKKLDLAGSCLEFIKQYVIEREKGIGALARWIEMDKWASELISKGEELKWKRSK